MHCFVTGRCCALRRLACPQAPGRRRRRFGRIVHLSAPYAQGVCVDEVGQRVVGHHVAEYKECALRVVVVEGLLQVKVLVK